MGRHTVIINGKEEVVTTENVCPPIPIRVHDWQAWIDSTYEYGMPVGEGKTEQEAIDNLIEQMEGNN